MKTTLFSLFIVICGMTVLPPDISLAQDPVNAVVTIPDAALRAKIAKILGKPSGAQLTAGDMLALTHLEVPNANIQDLTGLEHAHNLRELNLAGEYIHPEGNVNSNAISDFSPLFGLAQLGSLNLSYSSLSDVSFLSGLTQLTSLNLEFNAIADVAPLSNLKQLTSLDLGINRILDIAPLTDLKQLTDLSLWGNAITDVAPLSGLKQLTDLSLWGNAITDVAPLSGLKQLTKLNLSRNTITDVSPLVGLNLRDTGSIQLQGNPLNYAAIHTHIPAMQAKGIEVKFDPRTPTKLVKVLGTTQQGTVNTTLPLPFVVEVRDQQDRAFAGVPVTFAVTAGEGRLSVTTTTTDTAGRAHAYLTLGRTTTTVRVAATDISRSVQFTATVVRIDSPVTIPDANLRAQIAAALNKPPDALITLADMPTLRTLIADNANIRDLAGLQHAINLTTLSLDNNSVTDITPLAGLMQLKTLSLNNNNLWDLKPITGLIRLTTLSLEENSLWDIEPLVALPQLKTLHLRGNLLSDFAFYIHIPAIQARGTVVVIDSPPSRDTVVAADPLPQDYRPIVRLIYFLPKDRQPQPDIDEKMDRLIKDVQVFYANQMEAHGLDRKTFQIETDATGKAVVHHIIGRFPNGYYNNLPRTSDVWYEIDERFDVSKDVYLVAIDISSEILDGGDRCGSGQNLGSFGGPTLIPASGPCFRVGVAAHELGHAFGLEHDTRRWGKWIWTTSDISDPMTTSFCTAEWLDAHRAFNPSQSTANGPTAIEMLPPSLASPPNAIRLRFKVTNPNGLHQAQLHTRELETNVVGGFIGCKGLNGSTDTTVEFITTELTPNSKTVWIQYIDVHGNFSRSKRYPIDVAALLPRAEVVSIPDPNLAKAVRETLGLSRDDVLTTHTMLNLEYLFLNNPRITAFTGLERAHNLKSLNLKGKYIEGEGNGNSNAISDFSPLLGLAQLGVLNLSSISFSDVSLLSGLTQLVGLYLRDNAISDVSSLSNLTQLTQLELLSNAISDISPLSNLTQLRGLQLGRNTITDISALSGLTELETLFLSSNAITDISPLSNLTQLTRLNLEDNAISDISSLSNLTQLKTLLLSGNAIVDVAPLVGLNLTGSQWDTRELSLQGNPLSYASIHTHIPAVQAKGIEIKYDHRMPTTLVKISGTAQQGDINTALTLPFVMEVRDQRNRVFAGVPVTFTVTAGRGKLSVTTVTTDAVGRAQTTLTLGPNSGPNEVRVTAAQTKDTVTFTASTTEASRLTADINGDGTVNIQDLVLVSSNFGQTGQNSADVNDDGIVNISDLVLVAGAFGEGAAAAPTLHLSDIEGLTAAEVQDLLTQARQMALTGPAYLRGIAVLEQLLTLLLPKETALLPNYPNPFNPETWIPYQVAEPAEVTLHIYSVNGALVRTLTLGYQPVGIYKTRSHAAYWDGRNEQDECVASGVYFYTLSAGNFTATRKMLIQK